MTIEKRQTSSHPAQAKKDTSLPNLTSQRPTRHLRNGKHCQRLAIQFFINIDRNSLWRQVFTKRNRNHKFSKKRYQEREIISSLNCVVLLLQFTQGTPAPETNN